MFQLLLYWYNNVPLYCIRYSIPLPGRTTTAQKPNYMPHDILTCSPWNHTTRKTPQTRHVELGMQYNTCIVLGIPLPLGRRLPFCRFFLSLSFNRFYRNTDIVSVRYNHIVVSLPNDNTETVGAISNSNGIVCCCLPGTTWLHVSRFCDRRSCIFLGWGISADTGCAGRRWG